MVHFHRQTTDLKIKAALHKFHKIILLEFKGEKNIIQFSQRKGIFYNGLRSHRSHVPIFASNTRRTRVRHPFSGHTQGEM